MSLPVSAMYIRTFWQSSESVIPLASRIGFTESFIRVDIRKDTVVVGIVKIITAVQINQNLKIEVRNQGSFRWKNSNIHFQAPFTST